MEKNVGNSNMRQPLNNAVNKALKEFPTDDIKKDPTVLEKLEKSIERELEKSLSTTFWVQTISVDQQLLKGMTVDLSVSWLRALRQLTQMFLNRMTTKRHQLMEFRFQRTRHNLKLNWQKVKRLQKMR